LSFGRIKGEEVVVERFCDSDVCQVDFVAGDSDNADNATETNNTNAANKADTTDSITQ
jgi:hypothetical protein